MDLSFSSINTFKTCRRKFKFSTLDYLKPKKDDTSTSTGSFIHEAFEDYFLGKSIQDCSHSIGDKYDDLISKAQSPWESEGLVVDKQIALGMWNFYPFHLCNFKTIPEQKFRIRIPGYKDVWLVGYLDGLFKDSVSGKTLIREVKTTGLSMQQMKDRSGTSSQATCYVWAVQKLLGERVHGVWYDIIRKPLLRRNKTETAQGFADRNYKVYEDAKNPEDMDKLYATFPAWRTEVALQQFEEDLKKDVREILRAVKKDYLQRNTDACHTYNRDCPFMKLCFCEGEPDPDMVAAFFDQREKRDSDEKETLVKGCKNPLS